MDDNVGVFVISVAAELAGMHPQTLRQYDRLGLVTPERTSGRGRRYSPRDIRTLRQVQHMSQEEGINLEGIRRILAMQRRVRELETEIADLRRQVAAYQAAEAHRSRVFAAGTAGDVVALKPGSRPLRPRREAGQALVVWHPPAGTRRYMPFSARTP